MELAMSSTARLILVLVVVVFVGMLTFTMVRVFVAQSQEYTCGVSANVMAVTKQFNSIPGVVDLNSPFDLYCPRKLLRVQRDGVHAASLDILKKKSKVISYTWPYVLPDGKRTVREKLVGTDEEKTRQLAALATTEMETCWNAFSEGKIRFMDEETSVDRIRSCVICSEIEVDTAVRADPSALRSYQQVQRPYINESMTYKEYLYPGELGVAGNDRSNSQWCNQKFFPQDISLEQGQAYAIVFMSWSSDFHDTSNGKSSLPWILAASPIILVGGPPGWILGSTLLATVTLADFVGDKLDYPDAERLQTCRTIGIVPRNDVPRICDMVVN